MSTSTERFGVQLESPFPGLRPFEANESFLFFGRDAQTEELLRRLATHRFLAVVGSSGSGKSSLVRAGLLPALYRGYLVGTGSHWRIAVLRPGDAPLSELADNLVAALGLDRERKSALLATLRSSSLGLVNAVRGAELVPGERLFILVDQFEELFRYAEGEQQEPSNEAFLFVEALLSASAALDVPIYVTITMRSDFLGDCARFPGLSETLSESQYLIPRLSRVEQEEAIRKPLRMASVEVTTQLVQRVLNDSADELDQLPVLQHCLLRTYRAWRKAGVVRPLNLTDYDEAGTMKRALDQHAEAVYRYLPDDDHRLTAKHLFRCLTTIRGGRLTRRPQKFGNIAAILGIEESSPTMEQLRTVIRRFGEKKNSFLFFSGGELEAASVIDISHESLIRNWQRLMDWTLEEHRQSEWYRSLARDAALYARGEKGTWRDPALARVVQLSSENDWNEHWADQYAVEPVFGDRRSVEALSFAQVMGFLGQSRQDQEREKLEEEKRRNRELEAARRLASEQRRAKRLSWWVASLVALLALAGGLQVLSLRMTQAAQQQTVDLQIEQARASTEVDGLKEQLRTLQSSRDEAGQPEAERERLKREAEDLRRRLEAAQKEKRQAELAASRRQMNDTATQLIHQLQRGLDETREQLEQLAQSSSQLRAMKSIFDLNVIARERSEALERTLVALRAAGYSIPDAKVQIGTVQPGLWIATGEDSAWAKLAAEEIEQLCERNGFALDAARRADFGPRQIRLHLQ